MIHFFFFSSRRRHTRSLCDWSSDVCSSDLRAVLVVGMGGEPEGLTEGLQGLVRRYAPALPPPDVVRRSEERRVGKGVDFGGRPITETKKSDTMKLYR